MIQLSDKEIEKMLKNADTMKQHPVAMRVISILYFLRHPKKGGFLYGFWQLKKDFRKLDELPIDKVVSLFHKNGIEVPFQTSPDLVVQKIREAEKYYQQFRDINPEHPEAKDIPPSWLKLAKKWEQLQSEKNA